MLTFSSSRRDFLRVGALGFGGLMLPDILRLRAATRTREKSVIFVYLFGGPSHVDSYDMKPEAPVEIRGEFKPTKTNVTGFDICELMPMQAKIANKLALVRNLSFNPNFHDPVELFSGFRKPTEAGRARGPTSARSSVSSGAANRACCRLTSRSTRPPPTSSATALRTSV